MGFIVSFANDTSQYILFLTTITVMCANSKARGGDCDAYAIGWKGDKNKECCIYRVSGVFLRVFSPILFIVYLMLLLKFNPSSHFYAIPLG